MTIDRERSTAEQKMINCVFFASQFWDAMFPANDI